jgi:chaperonin GroES
MKIKPIYDRVLVKPVEEKTSASGIYIPKEATERSQVMTIVAIGSGVAEGVFKIADKVVVSKYAGTAVSIDNEIYYVLNQYDILAKEEL